MDKLFNEAVIKVDSLHCGACGEEFDSTEALSTHLNSCPAAQCLTALVNRIHIAGDLTGHPLAHLLASAIKNSHLIRRYCYAVADDMWVVERARLHVELCDTLGLAYNEFRPFEDSSITSLPTREDALKIFYRALHSKADEIITQFPDSDKNTAKRFLTMRFFRQNQGSTQ